jgi:copper(I)-binding protein
MYRFFAHHRRAPIGLLIGLLLVAGCTMPMAQPVAPAAPAAAQISLLPAPEGRLGEYLIAQVTSPMGQPITDAQVALVGNMNHAGMVPVEAAAVTDDADGAADGRYRLPFAFTMLGDWIITVTVTLADGTTVEQEIPATVSEAGATIAGVPANALSLTDVRARPIPTAGGTGGVFMTIHNTTATADRLISASSPIAPAVEVHETVADNGMMRMRQLVDGLPIPASAVVTLKPGGYHIMVIGVDEAMDVGASFALTLVFEAAGEMTLDVPVVAIEESMSGMNR